MSKEALIERLAESGNVPKTVARKQFDDLFDAMTAIVGDGTRLLLPGFGTFDTKQRSARPGRNPQTGETIEIAAKRVVQFRPAPPLRDRLNPAPKIVAPRRQKRA